MKLSIITINRNNLDGLKKTVGSVFSQTFKDFEYIVIDGASTDGSADYIKSYAERLTYWVSEPDTGIYNAMNKGILASHGEYLLMLNSGDFLVDEKVLERVIPELDGTDLIQGNILEDRQDGTFRNRGYGKSDLSFVEVMNGHFLHQAMFINNSLHSGYGLYDDSYKKNSDTYFFWKVLGFGNASFRYVDIDIANFDVKGMSSDSRWKSLDEQEDARWYRENFPVRLQRMYKEVPKKIKLYDTLHGNKLFWYLTMFFIRIISKKKSV